jgi:8-oxo-dGTP diphosphatase
MTYLYTLCFIKQGDKILMLNRNKAPWLGIWNGVGGKRQADESPLECIHREIIEETNININIDQIIDKGFVTWNDDFKTPSLGLHLFYADLPLSYKYTTPIETKEGILSWKEIDWVNDKTNLGVSYNIPYFIEQVLYNPNRFHYHCKFNGYQLLGVEVRKI